LRPQSAKGDPILCVASLLDLSEASFLKRIVVHQTSQMRGRPVSVSSEPS
jgi:hypothetical protein